MTIRLTTLLTLGAFLLTVGCSDKPDPRSRPGFVDTTDPAKVMKTMDKLPKSRGGGMGAGAGKPPEKAPDK